MLIDTGNGPSPLAGEDPGRLVAVLAAEGIPRASITHVLLTHAHPDHIGGLVVSPDTTELAFPNATVYMSRAEARYWRGDGASFDDSDIPLVFFDTFFLPGTLPVLEKVRLTAV